MLLAVATLVVGTRSVDFLLVLISTAEVIRVLGPPLQIEPPLLFQATLRPATGFLPFLEPRMGMKPMPTERTPPPREHRFFLRAKIFRRKRSRRRGRKEKE